MKRITSLSLRVVGAMVAAAIVVVGMPTPPASAAPLDHVTITASTPSQVEGNSGTTSVSFAIAYTGNPNPFSIDWATADGTATAGSDYVAASGTVTFSGLGSDRTKTAAVLIKGDTTAEANETFTVTISNPQPSTNVVIDTPTATQTIADDDSSASFAIGDVTAAEGNAGSSTFSFAVTKTGSTGFTTSVDFATANGTATVGDGDYASASGTLSFLPGDTSKSVDVTVYGDTKHEADETFTANLSGAVNATITDSQGIGTITNDDQVPDVSIDDQVVAEGNSPDTTTMTFNVSLSNPSDQTITVDYTTTDGTATTADGDYVATSGTLTFDPGQTTKTVNVTVNGDNTHEPDETLTLDLSTATNANIFDNSGLGTITNDDPIPDVSIDDQSIAEGDTGTSTLTFNVTLSHASSDTVTVDYTTNNGTATAADGDYDAASGTVTFDPGQTTQTVDLTINGDTTHEADETFTVDLSNASNAGIADGSGIGTITNDDQVPDVSIDDQSITEGNAGTSTMTFNVTLSNPSDQTITVDYTTSDGTATTADADYQTAAGTVTFDPGETTATIDVTINGDTAHESDETFTVDLSNASNAGIADGSGLGTIQDDDAAPTISIADASVTEGDVSDTTLSFDVTLSVASPGVVTVDYTTNNGTATVADGDYDAGASTLTFGAGETSKTIDVTVHGDATYEADEHLTVDLSNASGATIADDSGTGTITNDDAAPTFAIDDVSLAEGNTGLTSLTFTVTKSGPTELGSSVHFATGGGTATAGVDYTVNSGTLSFGANATSKTVTVLVHGDTTFETNETFHVVLSSPTGGTISDATGVGTITNDDRQLTTLTLRRRVTPRLVIGRGLLEPASAGFKVRVALFRFVDGKWRRLRAKTVTVTALKDRDGDGKPDASYRATFKRPVSHGRFRLRARFVGTPTQLPAQRRRIFRL